jgi:hypothetical protein
MELRALVAEPASASDVWAHAVAGGRVVASTLLRPTANGQLQGLFHETGEAVIVDLGMSLDLDAHTLVADALLAAPDRRAATAAGLQALSGALGSSDDRSAALLGAAALLHAADEEDRGTRLREVEGALGGAASAATDVAVALDSPATRLVVSCARERNVVRDQVLRLLERTLFATLDRDTQQRRMTQAREWLRELDRFDPLLA